MLATLMMRRREDAAEGRAARRRGEKAARGSGFDREIRFCASTPGLTTIGALNLATEAGGMSDCV